MRFGLIWGLLTALALSGCVQPGLQEYRPVVDPARSSAMGYESDLAACRGIAQQAEAGYQQRQQAELGRNLMAGLLVGAVTGAVIGDTSRAAGAGAAWGAAAGAAGTNYELAHGGPRRIIDRCMADRGHRILSDLGRG